MLNFDVIQPEAFSPVTAHQYRFLKSHPPKRLFAVVSWGATATHWLAAALFDHPDIFCLHAGNLALRIFANGSQMDGLEYMRLVGVMGSTARAAGDVHGVSRYEIPSLSAALGERFQAAVVVRNPIPRLLSQLALFNRAADIRGWGDVSYLDPLIRDAGCDPKKMEYHEKLTFHGVNMLNSILEERDIARIFRSEDLTSDPECLLDLVDHISRGNVPRNPDWAAQAIKRRYPNSRGTVRILSEWEKFVVRKVVRPEAWEAYAELGYRLEGI